MNCYKFYDFSSERDKTSPRARVKLKDDQEKRVAMKTKMMVTLYRHKELLKKEILRKRALLEKELQYEIQVLHICFKTNTSILTTSLFETEGGE